MAASRSTLPIPIPTTFNVSALARGWVPTPSAPTKNTPLSPIPLPGSGRTLGIVVLAGIAVAIGALALAINGQTGWRFGTTTPASVTFAWLALGGDLLVLVLPAAAVALWHARRPVLAASAWTTWTVAAALAALASLGFVELYTSDTAAVRQAIIATSSSLGNSTRMELPRHSLLRRQPQRRGKPSARSAVSVAAIERGTSGRHWTRLKKPLLTPFRPLRASALLTRRLPRLCGWRRGLASSPPPMIF